MPLHITLINFNLIICKKHKMSNLKLKDYSVCFHPQPTNYQIKLFYWLFNLNKHSK